MNVRKLIFFSLLDLAAVAFSSSASMAASYGGRIGWLAGSGLAGHEDGPAKQASFSDAFALTLDPGKYLYLLEQNGDKVRRVGIGTKSEVETALDLRALGRPGAIGLIYLEDKLWVIYPKSMDAYTAWDKSLLRVKLPFKVSVAAARSHGMDLLDSKGRVFRMTLEETGKKPMFEEYALSATAKALAVVADKTVVLEGMDPVKGLVQVQVFDAQMKSLGIRDVGLSPADQVTISKAGMKMLGVRYDDGTEKLYLYGLKGKLLKVSNFDDPQQNFRDLVLPYRGGIENPYYPFQSIGGLTIDLKRRTLYLADLVGFQLAWVKDYDFDADSFGTRVRDFECDYAYPRTRLPGVRRVLCYGTSYLYFAGGGKSNSLNKRVEHYLNLGAEEGVAYEVIFGGGPSPGNLERTRDSFTAHKDFDVDLILLTFNEFDIWNEMINYLHAPIGEDGTPLNGVDPELLLEDHPEKHYQNKSMEIYGEFKRHAAEYAPDITVNSAGQLVYDNLTSNIYRFFSNPSFVALATQATLSVAGSMVKEAKRVFPGKPLVLMFYPTRNFLGKVEVVPDTRPFSKMEGLATFDVEPLKKGLDALGIKVIDMQSACRFRALSYFPLFLEDGHLNPKGADVLGYLSAEQLRPLLAPKRVP